MPGGNSDERRRRAPELKITVPFCRRQKMHGAGYAQYKPGVQFIIFCKKILSRPRVASFEREKKFNHGALEPLVRGTRRREKTKKHSPLCSLARSNRRFVVVIILLAFIR
jgi:hypothetical protein